MPGRNSIKGKSRKPKKRKCAMVSFESRLAVLEHLDSSTVADTIDFFSFLNGTYRSDRRKIERWRNDRARIESMTAVERTKHRMRQRAQGSATLLCADDEATILQWINDLRKDGIPISSLMLHLKAVEVAAASGIDGFRGSWSWRKGFLRRHRLSIRMRTRQGQVNGAEAEAARIAFSTRVRSLMQLHQVQRVYNADQTAINFEYCPKQTINATGVKTVWVRCANKDKERLTAMLLGDSDGNKYTPIAVVKARPSSVPATQVINNTCRNGFGRRMWGDIAPVMDSTDLMIYGNAKGWWNEDLSLAFLTFHFGGRTQDDEPVLLLWDDMSAHWTTKVTAYAASKRVILEKVPPHFTFCCQPADVAWNRPLKDRLRKSWIDYLRAQIAATQMVAPPNRNTVLHWLHAAWQGLSVATIANGFKKCGLHPSTMEAPTACVEDDEPDMTIDDDLYAQLAARQAFDGVVARRDELDTELYAEMHEESSGDEHNSALRSACLFLGDSNSSGYSHDEMISSDDATDE